MKILVVDDEHGIRLLLEDILSGEGYQIVTAENGKEALDKYSNDPVDLLILDYKLPVMDGIEVIKQLHNQGELTPTILMSGLIEQAEKDTADLPQVRALLEKPFDIQKVVELVDSVLTKSG